MKLILNCGSSDENFDGGCAYALVDLTPALAADLLAKLELFQRLQSTDRNLNEMYYWTNFNLVDVIHFGGCDIDALDDGPISEEDEERIQSVIDAMKGEIDEAPADFELPRRAQARTDGDQIIVRNRGIAFFCYPKHCDANITSAEIDVSMLREVAKGSR